MATRYFEDLAQGIALNSQSYRSHVELHNLKGKYDDEFRAEVRQALRDIKAQTAKD